MKRSVVGIGVAGLAAFAAWALLGPAGDLKPAEDRASAGGTLSNEVPVAYAATFSAVAAEADEASLGWTSLPIRLVSTVLREDTALSHAEVEHLGTLRSERLSEGDVLHTLPGARLLEIARRRIRVEYEGHVGWLAMSASPGSPLQIDPATRAFRRDLGRRILDRIREEAPPLRRRFEGAFLADARFSVVQVEDVAFGVRVEAVEPGGLYDQLGLQAGDLISSVNGVPPNATAALAPVVLKLASNEPIHLTLEREGELLEAFPLDPAILADALAGSAESLIGAESGELAD